MKDHEEFSTLLALERRELKRKVVFTTCYEGSR